MNNVGLYLHIPFCRAKCAYCDFNSYAQLEYLHQPYVQALCNEIRHFAQKHPTLTANTIYIGGGTPTILSPTLLSNLLAVCKEAFVCAAQAEITIEANPGTVSLDSLHMLRSAGMNRLSLGAQSFRETELRLLQRIHTAVQIREAFQMARTVGFTNINLDLIYGLPMQSMEHWQFNLEQAVLLAPEHISLYALSIEEDTPLARRIADGQLPQPDADLAAEMYVMAEERLEQAGYDHYELSNWAQRGGNFVCRHNLKYWQVEPYLGFGAGAHSCFASHRYHNVAHPQEYIAHIEADLSTVENDETIGPEEAMAETMLLGLRLTEGVRFEDFAQRHRRDLQLTYSHELAELEQLGLLVRGKHSVRLTPKGRLLANQVFLRFWPVEVSS